MNKLSCKVWEFYTNCYPSKIHGDNNPIHSIIDQPSEDKFRHIKKSNAAIQKKLLSLVDMENLLLTIGYEATSEEQLSFNPENSSHAAFALKQVDYQAKLLTMTPEQR